MEPRVLLIRSRTQEDMNRHIKIWEGLLKSISTHQRPFLPLLVEEMLFHLVSPSELDTSTDTHREALLRWLEYLATDQGWAASRKKFGLDGSIIISTCFQCPNVWTARLLESLLAHVSFSRIAAIHKNQQSTSESRLIEEKTHTGIDTQAASAGGWQPVQGIWTPKAIGLI